MGALDRIPDERDDPVTRHPAHCYADDGKLDCACPGDDPAPEPPVDDYGDPLVDREPMGGDPSWREREL